MKQIIGQISIEEFLKSNRSVIDHCGNCICKKCLYWWSSRCPYGECYAGKRAKEDPYDKRFPERTPRTSWSDWDKPGEQEHWCRGGSFYPVSYCDKFVKYKGCEVKYCIKAVITEFQDGYISCPLVDNIGCEACYRDFMEEK